MGTFRTPDTFACGRTLRTARSCGRTARVCLPEGWGGRGGGVERQVGRALVKLRGRAVIYSVRELALVVSSAVNASSLSMV